MTDATVKPKRVGARIMPSRQPKEKRKSKFNAVGERYDGIYFQSKAELLRYQQLKAMLDAGLIADLETQPSYPIIVNNQKICSYRADFRYKVVDELGRTLRIGVEDVKGWKTDVYVIKKKLVEAVHHINLCEIPSSKLAEWANRVAP